MTNPQALADFQAARELYLARRFHEARQRMQRYRRNIDYRQFQRHDNRSSRLPQSSVIIVSYGTGTALLECLDSVLNQSAEAFEIILVDNGNNESVHDQLAQYPVLWIRPPVNLLPSEGRNVGASFACGKWLIFLDDDALMAPGYLEEVGRAMEKNPSYAALRGRIVPRHESAHSPPSHYDLGNRPLPARLNVEGNMVIQHRIFAAVEGFDPLLFGHEGNDLTRRCQTMFPELAIYYWPMLVIYHDFADGRRLESKRERQALAYEYIKTVEEQTVSNTGVSILIRAKDNLASAEAFLASLAEYNTHKPVEVLLTAQDSKQALEMTCPYLSRMFIRVLPLSSISAGNELDSLVSKARHDLLFFPDHQVKFVKDSLPELIRILDNNGVTAFSGKKSPVGGTCILCARSALAATGRLPVNIPISELTACLIPSPKKEVPKKSDKLPSRHQNQTSQAYKIQVQQQVLNRKCGPLISIIIPVFNKKHSIGSTIESIFSNGYNNIEVICVDDCSTDESLKIIEEKQSSKNITLIRQNKNRGAGAARNVGILKAKGEYIFFLDADDIIAQGALQKLVNEAQKNKSDIVRGKITGRNEKGVRHCLAKESLLHTEYVACATWNKHESLWFYWYFTCNLYRTKFIKENHLFFPEGMRNEDPLFLCRCFLSSPKITLLPEIVYYYTIGDEQRKKTPSYSFLKGWSLTNYYIYQFIQNKPVQANYFMAHFPSLLPHSINAVKYLNKKGAIKIISYIKLIFKNANIEWLENQEKSPWSRKVNISKATFNYIESLVKKQPEDIYGELVKSNKLTPNLPIQEYKVTVVMPCYNSAGWLLQSIGSLQHQTFNNWELIVVDDASEDESFNIVKELGKTDKRINIIENSTNKGKSYSRNVGIRNATGDYLFFLDADDWLPKNALESMLATIINDNVDVILGQVFKIRDGSAQITEGDHANYQHDKIRRKKALTIPKIFDSTIACNKLIKYEFIKNNKLLFNTELQRFEDTEFIWRLWLHNPSLSLLTEPTYYYRQQAADTVDRSQRKIGGPEQAGYFRLQMINSLIDYEILNLFIGEKILLPRLIIMLIRQLYFSNKHYLKDNINLAKEIIKKMPEGLLSDVSPIIFKVLIDVKEKRSIKLIDDNWGKLEKLSCYEVFN